LAVEHCALVVDSRAADLVPPPNCHLDPCDDLVDSEQAAVETKEMDHHAVGVMVAGVVVVVVVVGTVVAAVQWVAELNTPLLPPQLLAAWRLP
jgi:hypothetical protein